MQSIQNSTAAAAGIPINDEEFPDNDSFFQRCKEKTHSIFSTISHVAVKTGSFVVSVLKNTTHKVTQFAQEILLGVSFADDEDDYNFPVSPPTPKTSSTAASPVPTNTEDPTGFQPTDDEDPTGFQSTDDEDPSIVPQVNSLDNAVDSNNFSELPPITAENLEESYQSVDNLGADSIEQRYTIKIPAQGDCAFLAIYVGLKLRYSTVAQKLGADPIRAEELSFDLSTPEFTELLKPQAVNLRAITTNYIESQLNCLAKNKSIRNRVMFLLNSQDTGSPMKKAKAERRANIIAETIRNLKAAIDDHNQAVDRKIADDIDSYEKNKTRFFEAEQEATPLFEEFNRVVVQAERTYMENPLLEYHKNMQAAAEGMYRNMESFLKDNSSKIECQLNGFEMEEIPEIKRYINDFMKKDFNYASTAEIAALSNYFNVPIIVQPIYDIQPTDDIEPTDEIPLTDDIEPTDEIPLTDDIEPTDEIPLTDDIEPTDEIQLTDEDELPIIEGEPILFNAHLISCRKPPIRLRLYRQHYDLIIEN